MRASEAKGRQVVSTADAATLGKVDLLLVDPATAQVVAVRLSKASAGRDFLRWTDIASFGPDAVTVASADPLTDKPGGVDVLGARLLEESGDELGKATDFEFDSIDGSVQTLFAEDAEIRGNRMLALGSYALMVRNQD